MVKSIYLQDGEEIFVDDEDYERVKKIKMVFPILW